MRRILLAVAILSATAYPLMTAYKVEPVKASWSGWTPSEFPNNYISQSITCNFDSLKRVELFVGGIGAGGDFNLEVRDAATNELVTFEYDVTPAGDHRWLPFENLTVAGSFTKGRQYEFKFTRAGSDSINYYYRWDSSYPYGGLKVGGSSGCGETYPVEMDLAMRVYGAMDARTFWSVTDTSSLIPA